MYLAHYSFLRTMSLKMPLPHPLSKVPHDHDPLISLDLLALFYISWFFIIPRVLVLQCHTDSLH